MKAGIRIHSLTLDGDGERTLPHMEAHGKREDQSSRRRRVRDAEPLVYKTLDLGAAYQAHIDGCKMNAGLKRPVLHAIIQFPPELGTTAQNRQKMLDHAVRFINQTHGGNAVFAARLDQDETGLATVDVFFAPKYVKVTRRKEVVWISTSKHGKELAEKHREEIMRRNKDQFSTAPRHIGIALQAELYEYLASVGLKLEPRKEKERHAPDRVEPETFKARQRAAEIEAEAQERLEASKATEARLAELLAEAEADAEAARLDREAAEAALQSARDRASRQKARIEGAASAAAKEAALTAAEMVVATITGKPVPETPMTRHLRPIVQPILRKLSSWWGRFAKRVAALPPEDRPEPPPDFRASESKAVETEVAPNGP